MTFASTMLRTLAVSCTVLLFACDSPPGDVGETADTGESKGMPTTASGGSSSTGEPTSDSMPTTASGGSSSTGEPTSDSMPTTASGTGTSSTGGAESGGMPTTASGSSTGGDTEGVPVDDCAECGVGDICLRFVAFTTERFCVPLPGRCAADVDCECGAQLCNELYDVCIDPAEEGTLNCECSTC